MNNGERHPANGPVNVEYDVIVIGAGIAGVSAVHHLVTLGRRRQNNDHGVDEEDDDDDDQKDRSSPLRILIVDAGSEPGEGVGTRKSGSATMKPQTLASDDTPMTTTTTSRIKMMNQMFECFSEEFVKHHGHEGARRYMQATKTGLELQKTLAKELGDDLLTELGTYYVCLPSEYDELYAEYEFFRSLGDCCEDLEFVETMDQVEGASKDFPYGIYFPHDAAIDSSEYAKRLLKRSVTRSSISSHLSSSGPCIVTTRFHTRVVQVDDGQDWCTVRLDNGEILLAHHVVVATGAMDPLPQLHGLLIPCYSYLALVRLPPSSSTASTTSSTRSIQQSANFFNWSLCHDWCFDRGLVRVSGEDRFSAYKDPHVAERCGRMIDWIRDRYPPLSASTISSSSQDDKDVDDDHEDIPQQQYGIYSETPDFVPLIGTRTDQSRICYLVGCNATGQTILSYAASLVPALLGYTTTTSARGEVGTILEESQKEALRLFSIRRFTELPR